MTVVDKVYLRSRLIVYQKKQGCVDQVFVLRQLVEKVREPYLTMYVVLGILTEYYMA